VSGGWGGGADTGVGVGRAVDQVRGGAGRLRGLARDHLARPLYRDGYALILSTGITSGLGFVFWVLAARLYPAETVGRNSAALAASILVSGVAQLNLMGALLRFLPRAGGATTRLIAGAYLVPCALAAALGVGFVAGVGRWAPELAGLRDDPRAGAGFVALAMVWCLAMLGDNVLTALGKTAWVPKQNAAVALAKIVLLVGFAGVGPAAAAGWPILMAIGVPLVVAALPVGAIVFLRVAPAHARATADTAEGIGAAGLARFVAADYAGMLCTMGSTLTLPILVTEVVGPRENAYFYQAWLLATTLNTVAGNMATSLTVAGAGDPTAAAGHARAARRQLARLLIVPVIALVVAAPLALRPFGAEYAAGGATALRLLALAVPAYAVVVVGLALARVRRRMGDVILLQALSCAVTLGLAAALAPRFGVAGVAAAWLVAQFVAAAATLLRERRAA